ncbi:protein BPS1, chloroplastic [Capsella rubella]|uniref:protein BPS1, chloroplastic n=1 Tax=Capsella rubella TaxID=81985 RepID=UPI000CD5A5E8|nr:protein BPS1, chloroplastic [Capsella rubella]
MSSERTTSQCFFRQNKYFRMLFPKSSNLSSALWNNFESSLTERLKKLIPQNKDEILTLPWMIFAMELLYDTHNDINIFITNLKLHDITDWSDVYLDITVKFMDFCNAISSLLGCIDHCILRFKVLWHKLEMKSEEEQCNESCSTLNSCRKDITAEIRKYHTVLGRYVESLNLYRCVCNSFVEFRQRCFSNKCLKAVIVGKRFLEFADYYGDDVLVHESVEESNGEGKEEIEKLDHELDELSRRIRNLFSITLKGRDTICEGLLSEFTHA